MFILKKGNQPGVYVPLRALFLVSLLVKRSSIYALEMLKYKIFHTYE